MNAPLEAPPPSPVQEPWDRVKARLDNLGGSIGGKNYSHTGGINSSFEGHLFGAVDPSGKGGAKTVLHEKPVHRLMQVMFSKGYTIDEIALQTGYTKPRVAVILRQPWAQVNIVGDIRASVQDEIKTLLEAAVMPTIKRVLQLQTDETAPHAVRLAACKETLDRFLGRPNQPITTNNNVDPTKLTNAELDARVAALVAGVAGTPGNTEKP